MPARKPTPWPVRVEGPALGDRAVALAGLLAERGVQSLDLRRAARDVRLHARVTDLPATLAEHCPCTLRFVDPAGGIELLYRVEADSITLESAQDPPGS